VHGIKGANEYQSVPNKAKRKRRQMKLQSPVMNTRSKAAAAKWGAVEPHVILLHAKAEPPRGSLRACLKMGRGSAAGEFWFRQGGERRGRPPAVCSARTNAVQAGKPRRPEGLGGKGPLAALLVGHRPLRVCFLLAPCQSNPSLPNRTPPHFQTGSESSRSIRPQTPPKRRHRYSSGDVRDPPPCWVAQ